ncbi:MAG: TolC family protein [Burkholderiales bacterium]|nr:TolC family protein [Burkholderiales bacterium]
MTDGVREFKIEQALVFNLFALATMPQAQAIERRRFEQTQRAVALAVLQLAAQTRKAYYEALAAAERLHYRGQVNEAAAAGAELARRMAEAGNWSALQRAREHRFEAEAALQLALARHSHTAARERLARLLGLWGRDTAFQLPARLPDLPAQPAERGDIEQRAIGQRIDLQIARIEIDALADTLGLTRTNRFINVFEAGPARVLEGERGAGYKRGYEIRFELPVFDWGSARVARAQAIYLQSVERAAQAAIEARSQVREAYGTYRTRWDIARHHRQEMIPISQRISEENGLRYNGMLIGVFELLADTREQIATVIEAIDAARDFWVAQADLDMTMLGSPESDPLARSHR